MNKVINLISGPRNISTALMYAFAQLEDCTVLDEPFYGYYLTHAPLEVIHPSHNEIIAQMETNEDAVIQKINKLAIKQQVFVKGMAHHYLNPNPSYILDWENVILIRHPKKLLASFAKVISNPSLSDIGLKKAAELFQYLSENNKTPVVIDSDELMVNPKQYLQKLCDCLAIPFSDSMLQWSPGGIPEDGIWAKHWYKNVHQTTGFKVQQKKPASLAPHLETTLQEALPYYNILKEKIVINDSYATKIQP